MRVGLPSMLCSAALAAFSLHMLSSQKDPAALELYKWGFWLNMAAMATVWSMWLMQALAWRMEHEDEEDEDEEDDGKGQGGPQPGGGAA